MIKLLEKASCEITLVLDTRDPSGVLGSTLSQSNLSEIVKNIENIQSKLNFEFLTTSYDSKSIQSKKRNKATYRKVKSS